MNHRVDLKELTKTSWPLMVEVLLDKHKGWNREQGLFMLVLNLCSLKSQCVYDGSRTEVLC